MKSVSFGLIFAFVIGFNITAFAGAPSICDHLFRAAEATIKEDSGENIYVTFPAGIKAPLQLNFPGSVPAPKIILKQVKEKFDQLDEKMDQAQTDFLTKTWLKHRARLLILEEDFTMKFHFKMEIAPGVSVNLYTKRSGNIVGPDSESISSAPLFNGFQYLRSFDGNTYVQAQLEGDSGRDMKNMTYGKAYATVEARVNTKTGEYTDIKVIRSSVQTYKSGGNIPY